MFSSSPFDLLRYLKKEESRSKRQVPGLSGVLRATCVVWLRGSTLAQSDSTPPSVLGRRKPYSVWVAKIVLRKASLSLVSLVLVSRSCFSHDPISSSLSLLCRVVFVLDMMTVLNFACEANDPRMVVPCNLEYSGGRKGKAMYQY